MSRWHSGRFAARSEKFVDVIVVRQLGDIQIVRTGIFIANIDEWGHFLQDRESVITNVLCRVERAVRRFGIRFLFFDNVGFARGEL